MGVLILALWFSKVEQPFLKCEQPAPPPAAEQPAQKEEASSTISDEQSFKDNSLYCDPTEKDYKDQITSAVLLKELGGLIGIHRTLNIFFCASLAKIKSQNPVAGRCARFLGIGNTVNAGAGRRPIITLKMKLRYAGRVQAGHLPRTNSG